ncbi:MAG: class I SAM-dependent methyltransferase [Hyphomicrobiales bacterium]|nr:class I SAM-dependent methyltransferase [Hyphomicrobiales bacterium]
MAPGTPPSFDPFWEDRYARGHAQRYPWDVVVSFVYRNAPGDRPRKAVSILEVGCGTGANLWFAAREGFAVTGIDASASAIAGARARFDREGLDGTLIEGDFTDLPFADNSFDLAIDRCSITCCGRTAARRAVAEVHRCLAPGGRFLFVPYSTRHTSAAAGRDAGDGLVDDIRAGSLADTGQICFYDRDQVAALFARGWTVRSMAHLEETDPAAQPETRHAEWRVVAEKAAP